MSETEIVNDTAVAAAEPETETKVAEEPLQPDKSGDVIVSNADSEPLMEDDVAAEPETETQVAEEPPQLDDSGDVVVINTDSEPLMADAERKQPPSADSMVRND